MGPWVNKFELGRSFFFQTELVPSKRLEEKKSGHNLHLCLLSFNSRLERRKKERLEEQRPRLLLMMQRQLKLVGHVLLNLGVSKFNVRRPGM